MDLIKTWPAQVSFRRMCRVITDPEMRFYFSLGRGHPHQEVERIWFCHRGRIRGSFQIEEIIRYEKPADLPPVLAMDGTESRWQFRPGIWVAMCPPPFIPLRERLYMTGFRGWHYFNFFSYRRSLDAKIKL